MLLELTHITEPVDPETLLDLTDKEPVGPASRTTSRPGELAQCDLSFPPTAGAGGIRAGGEPTGAGHGQRVLAMADGADAALDLELGRRVDQVKTDPRAPHQRIRGRMSDPQTYGPTSQSYSHRGQAAVYSLRALA